MSTTLLMLIFDGLGADTLKVYSANDRWLSQFLTSPITYKYHLGGTYAL